MQNQVLEQMPQGAQGQVPSSPEDMIRGTITTAPEEISWDDVADATINSIYADVPSAPGNDTGSIEEIQPSKSLFKPEQVPALQAIINDIQLEGVATQEIASGWDSFSKNFVNADTFESNIIMEAIASGLITKGWLEPSLGRTYMETFLPLAPALAYIDFYIDKIAPEEFYGDQWLTLNEEERTKLLLEKRGKHISEVLDGIYPMDNPALAITGTITGMLGKSPSTLIPFGHGWKAGAIIGGILAGSESLAYQAAMKDSIDWADTAKAVAIGSIVGGGLNHLGSWWARKADEAALTGKATNSVEIGKELQVMKKETMEILDGEWIPKRNFRDPDVEVPPVANVYENQVWQTDGAGSYVKGQPLPESFTSTIGPSYADMGGGRLGPDGSTKLLGSPNRQATTPSPSETSQALRQYIVDKIHALEAADPVRISQAINSVIRATDPGKYDRFLTSTIRDMLNRANSAYDSRLMSDRAAGMFYPKFLDNIKQSEAYKALPPPAKKLADDAIDERVAQNAYVEIEGFVSEATVKAAADNIEAGVAVSNPRNIISLNKKMKAKAKAPAKVKKTTVKTPASKVAKEAIKKAKKTKKDKPQTALAAKLAALEGKTFGKELTGEEKLTALRKQYEEGKDYTKQSEEITSTPFTPTVDEVTTTLDSLADAVLLIKNPTLQSALMDITKQYPGNEIDIVIARYMMKVEPLLSKDVSKLTPKESELVRGYNTLKMLTGAVEEEVANTSMEAVARKAEKLGNEVGPISTKRIHKSKASLKYGVDKGGTEFTFVDGSTGMLYKDGSTKLYVMLFPERSGIPGVTSTSSNIKEAVEEFSSYSYNDWIRTAEELASPSGWKSAAKPKKEVKVTIKKSKIVPPKSTKTPSKSVTTKSTPTSKNLTGSKGHEVVLKRLSEDWDHVFKDDISYLNSDDIADAFVNTVEDFIRTEEMSVKQGNLLLGHIEDNMDDWTQAAHDYVNYGTQDSILGNPLISEAGRQTAEETLDKAAKETLKSAQGVLGGKEGGAISHSILVQMATAGIAAPIGYNIDGERGATIAILAALGMPYASRVGRVMWSEVGTLSERLAADASLVKAAREAAKKSGNNAQEAINAAREAAKVSTAESRTILQKAIHAYNNSSIVGRPHKFFESLGKAGKTFSELMTRTDERFRAVVSSKHSDIRKSLIDRGFKTTGDDADLIYNILRHTVSSRDSRITPKHRAAATDIRSILNSVLEDSQKVGLISKETYNKLLDNAKTKGWMPRVYDTRYLNTTDGANHFIKSLTEFSFLNSESASSAISALTGASGKNLASIVASMNMKAGKLTISHDTAKTILKMTRGNNIKRSKYLENQRKIPEAFEKLLDPFLITDLNATTHQYLSDAFKRIEYAKTFGVKDEKVHSIVSMMKAEVGHEDYSEKLWEVYHLSVGDPASEALQKFMRLPEWERRALSASDAWASYKLVLAQIVNAGQPIINGTVRMTATGENPLIAFMSSLKAVAKAYTSKEAREVAERAGAAFESASMQFMGEALNNTTPMMTRNTSLGLLSIFKDPHSFLKATGFIGVERANRIAGFNLGKAHIESLLGNQRVLLAKQSTKGLSKFEKAKLRKTERGLSELGMDFKLDPSGHAVAEMEKATEVFLSTVTEMNKASRSISEGALKFTNDINFINTPMTRPIAWNSPYAKIFTKFKNFTFNQMHFLNKNIIAPLKDPRLSRAQRIETSLSALSVYGVVGTGVGWTTDELRRFITNDDREFTLTERLIRGFTQAGAFGLVTDLFYQSAQSPTGFSDFFLGPIIKDIKDMSIAVYRSKEQESMTPILHKAERSFGPAKVIRGTARRTNESLGLGFDIPDLSAKPVKVGKDGYID